MNGKMLPCGLRPRTGSGFTLVEAVMSLLLVSILLVSAARATGGSSVVQYKSAERAKGRLLADALMAHIAQLRYESPAATPLFGIESPETSSSKANYDDVDDFNGWTESPPQDRDGTTLANMTGWRRAVIVERVTAANPATVSGAESGAKRITVNVYHNNVLAATRVFIRTKAP